jgi:hypothetical protein
MFFLRSFVCMCVKRPPHQTVLLQQNFCVHHHVFLKEEGKKKRAPDQHQRGRSTYIEETTEKKVGETSVHPDDAAQGTPGSGSKQQNKGRKREKDDNSGKGSMRTVMDCLSLHLPLLLSTTCTQHIHVCYAFCSASPWSPSPPSSSSSMSENVWLRLSSAMPRIFSSYALRFSVNRRAAAPLAAEFGLGSHNSD